LEGNLPVDPEQCGTLGNDTIDTPGKEGLNFPSPEHPTTNLKAAAQITKYSALFKCQMSINAKDKGWETMQGNKIPSIVARSFLQ